MTSSPTETRRSGSWAANAGLARRSGEISRTSTVPARTSASTWAQASRLVELMVAARRPARSAAAIWSRISASSGDTTSVGPAPWARPAAGPGARGPRRGARPPEDRRLPPPGRLHEEHPPVLVHQLLHRPDLVRAG